MGEAQRYLYHIKFFDAPDNIKRFPRHPARNFTARRKLEKY
jgi:hypothetical protein